MDIPALLISNIQQGRVVLFFGAGASKGAKNGSGNEPPDGRQLAKLLSEKFLDGNFNDWPLATVAAMSASEAGNLFEVQDYIKDIFDQFEPADFHLKLPIFKWKALITVNYDRIIEKAFLKQEQRSQELVVFISNDDRVETTMAAKPNPLQLIKLHGCITQTHNDSLPLILTTEQYVTHRKSREALYNRVSSLGYEFPIVFVGHGMEDSDLWQLLLNFADMGEGRPTYYAVSPNIPSELERLWGKKNITAIRGTFQQFLLALEDAIPEQNRKLMVHANIENPIERKIKVHEPMSPSCSAFLSNHLDYVHPDLPIHQNDPKSFYRGFDLGWYTVKNDLDVRRTLVDKLLFDVILRDEDERPTKVDLYVIKSAAGSGKSIVLRRTAWEAATQADVLVLYFRDLGVMNLEALREIYRLTKERIFLFIDDAADNAVTIEEVAKMAKRESIPLTIVTAERNNEWNVACEKRLSGLVSDDFELHRFSEAELEKLLERLEKYEMLGFLEELSKEQRLHELQFALDRQILVMLHEVTLGKPFQEILVDEYNALVPKKAKELYLSVCALNQLGVKVRAGIISRLYAIPFTKFREELFEPLEHVVDVEEHPVTGEMLYAARHKEIAAIVFDRILVDQTDRFDEYVKLLREIDISYDSDYQAYRRMINHRTLKELFNSYEDVIELFHIAAGKSPTRPLSYSSTRYL